MRTASLFVNSEIRPLWHLRRQLADAGHGLPDGSASGTRSLGRRIGLWIERTRQRQALAGLDDHMLRDIGITRVEVARECGKPFWR
jgi:uncharacterized protein YjiS (DUF1127 family)